MTRRAVYGQEKVEMEARAERAPRAALGLTRQRVSPGVLRVTRRTLPRTWAPAFLGRRVPAPQAPVLILGLRKTAFLLEAQTCARTQFIKHLPKEGWQGAGGGVGHPRDEWPSESGGRGASSLPGHLGAPAGHLSAKCSG